ncbi:uncharacterized protein LOC115891522 [Sitophilus oryzae]|uniref:Gustatory receptor n=1 Tax=Sitophilus oryzae TaxID=7048 RepID=A0A6J2YYG4_SITOR|nr:uncharacterized protein LOC115891522 [Sitophilus oryzae]
MKERHFFSKSFDVLSPLMVLCSIFGVCPPVYPKNGPKQNFELFYKIFSGFCVLGWIGAAIGVLFLKYELKSTVPYSVLVSDYFVHCGLTLVCVTMIISLVLGFTKGTKLKKIFWLLQNIDDKLGYDIKSFKPKIYFGIVFYLTLMVVYVIYDAFTWITFIGLDWYLLYIPKSLHICQLCLALLLPMTVLKFIHIRIKLFNTTLKFYGKTNMKELQVQIKDMKKLHSNLYELVITFNKVFGTVCFVGTIMVVGLIIHYVLMLLVYFEFQSELVGLKKNYVLAQCITGIVLPFMLIMSVATSGDSVSHEASKTCHICLSLMNRLQWDQNKNLTEDLRELALQCSFRKTAITAKRFFSVNHSMLGYVVSSIIAYLIVIVQFLSRSDSQNSTS